MRRTRRRGQIASCAKRARGSRRLGRSILLWESFYLAPSQLGKLRDQGRWNQRRWFFSLVGQFALTLYLVDATGALCAIPLASLWRADSFGCPSVSQSCPCHLSIALLTVGLLPSRQALFHANDRA